jgi:hypothetical protein
MKQSLLAIAVLVAACGDAAAPSVSMPSPERHAALFFPASAGTVHGAFTCDDCHDPQASSFAQFDCLHCHQGAHTDPAALAASHGAVAGFVFTSEGCYRCHPKGVGIDHAPLFPIASGAHAGIACAGCHTDPASRRDPATLACAACHLERDPELPAKHTGASIPIVDFAAASPACLRCHADSQVDAVSSHPAGESTPSGKPQHLTAGCTRCHSGFRADKVWAASWRTTPGCVTCHPNRIGGL